MKLSEVVRYLNLLESRELDPAYDSITNRLDGITHMIENYPLQFDSTASFTPFQINLNYNLFCYHTY